MSEWIAPEARRPLEPAYCTDFGSFSVDDNAAIKRQQRSMATPYQTSSAPAPLLMLTRAHGCTLTR